MEKTTKKAVLRSPWLEVLVLFAVVLLSFVALMLMTKGAETPPGGMSLNSISLLVFGFFLLSFAIAIIAVTAGIGGGVLFTPIMLAFTPVNSLMVRGTGLIVAMFSGLISSGPLARKGLGNLKLAMVCCLGYGSGSFIGAQLAIAASRYLGVTGEGLVRISLGLIVLGLAVYFLRGGIKVEWPQVDRVDPFTRWLGLSQPYYEESTGEIVDYRVARTGWGIVAMIAVGLISGFFGLGAGWAIVPVLNLVMAAPLKVAAACSGILIGMGDCISVWPYIFAGAIIPLFAALWLVGQVVGGIVGAQVLIRIQSGSIRLLLIGIMLYSSFGLVTKGLVTLGVISAVSGLLQIGVLVVILGGVVAALFGKFTALTGRRRSRGGRG
jgi:uncharacterized membrane protein YfcA